VVSTARTGTLWLAPGHQYRLIGGFLAGADNIVGYLRLLGCDYGVLRREEVENVNSPRAGLGW